MLRRAFLYLLSLVVLMLPMQSMAGMEAARCAEHAQHADADTRQQVVSMHSHHSRDQDHACANGSTVHKSAKCNPCCIGAMVAPSIAAFALYDSAAVLAAAPAMTFFSVNPDAPRQPPRPSFA